MRRNSAIIGPYQLVAQANASGIHDTFDQYNNSFRWPTSPFITSSTTNVTENTSVTFTVSAGVFTGTLYYTINNVTGTMSTSDFADGLLSGSISITNGSGSFDKVLIGDGIAEGEAFSVSLRSGSTSGDILATTETITVTDADAPLGEDLAASFFSIGEFQNNDLSSNTTSNYSVSEVQSGYSGTGRLYLIHKATQATTFYNDIVIGCVQVLSSTGTTVNEQWWFGISGNPKGWETNLSQVNLGSIGTGINITPTQASTSPYSYFSIVNGTTANRFSLATSTSSAQTGALDGIPEPTGPMTLGEKTVPQGANTYYIYRETSGSTVGWSCLCRSPSRTWSSGERVRVAYIIGNSTGYTPTDTIFVGIA